MDKLMRQFGSHVLVPAAFLGLAWLSSFLTDWPLFVAILWSLVGSGISAVLICPTIDGSSKNGKLASIAWDRPTKVGVITVGGAAIAYLGYALYLGWHVMPLPNSPRLYRAGPVLAPCVCIGMILPCLLKIYWLVKNGTPR